MRAAIASLLILLSVASAAHAQSNPGACYKEKGYIDVYKQFIEDWSDAVNKGTLVDPKKTEIAVWLTQWQNRMAQGEPVRTLCFDLIKKRAEGDF